MSGFARITTIDAVAALAAEVRCFADEARNAVEEAQMGSRRVVQWVQHDQRDYWTAAVRRAEDQVNEARINLERARMTRTAAGQRPSCDEEKAILEAAKRRLAHAKVMVEVVRRWGRVLDHEMREYESAVNPLRHWIDADTPQLLAAMERMRDALERYVGMGSVEEESRAASAVSPSGDEPEVPPPNVPPSEDGGDETHPEQIDQDHLRP